MQLHLRSFVAMLQVQQWLAGTRPFDQGVQLLKTLGVQYPDQAPSDTLLGLLEVGETSYARKLLLEALQAMKEERVEEALAAQPRAVLPGDTPDRVLHPHKDVLPIEAYPPALQAVRKLVWPLKEEQQFLRGGLETCPDPELRRQQAKRIMDIERERIRHWRRLDHWRLHGIDLGAPATETTVVPDRSALEKRKLTLRTYLTRYKENQAMLEKYTRELNEIEDKLKC